MDVLEVFESPFQKYRLGSDGDGGYVICDMPGKYDLLLSGGVETNISFEEAFLEKFPGTRCVAYDGTIENFPHTTYPIEFVRKNIDHLNNLKDIIEQYSDIFVKMDIEKWEYPWISSLEDSDIMRFKQIVIEFHFPHEAPNYRWPIIQRLKNTHKLVHIHGNNHCGTSMFEGQTVPHVFECTYVRWDEPLGRNLYPFPSNLDRRNNQTVDDITLQGYPYSVFTST